MVYSYRFLYLQIALLLGLMVFTGCAHYTPVTMTATPLSNSGDMPAIVGFSQSTSILGFGESGNASLEAALLDAKERAGDNKFTVSFVDQKKICIPSTLLPLICRTETDIFGYPR